jgi:hypothetical protein
VKFSKCTFARQ